MVLKMQTFTVPPSKYVHLNNTDTKLFLVPRAFPLEIGRGEKNPGDEVAKDRTVVVLLMRPRRSELFKKNCMIIFELLAREFITVHASFEF